MHIILQLIILAFSETAPWDIPVQLFLEPCEIFSSEFLLGKLTGIFNYITGNEHYKV